MMKMTQPVSVDTDWYQCNSCRNFVLCNIRSDTRTVSKIKEKGDCPDYIFSCTTRLRTTFRWCPHVNPDSGTDLRLITYVHPDWGYVHQKPIDSALLFLFVYRIKSVQVFVDSKPMITSWCFTYKSCPEHTTAVVQALIAKTIARAFLNKEARFQ